MEATARPPFERGAFLLLLAGTVYAVYITAEPVLLALIIAAAIASLTSGLFRLLVRAFRGRRRLAAISTTAVVLVGGLGPMATAIVLLGQRLAGEAAQLASEAAHGGAATIDRLAAKMGPLGPTVRHAAARVLPLLTESAPQLAKRAAELAATVGGVVAQAFIGLFLLVVSLYYFYLNGHAWRERVVALVPLPPDDVRAFFVRFHQASVGVFIGNLGSALVQGGLGTLGYWVIGAPVPLVWGLATFLAALVPAIGSALAWVPLAIYTAAAVGWWRGILLALYGALVISTVDNVVRPMLTRRSLAVHPLVTFVAVFGGLLSFGAAGILLGPLVAALAITVLDLYERRLGRRPPAPEPPEPLVQP